MKKTSDKSMPFFEHLKELRKRLIRCFVISFIVFLGCYFFREDLLTILKTPVEKPLQKYSSIQKNENTKNPADLKKLNCVCEYPESSLTFDSKTKLDCICNPNEQAAQKPPLVFIQLPEIFFTELKIAFFLALFFSFPYWIIEIWGFVLPALYRKEKKIFWTFVPSTFFFFLGGAIFGYLVVFPVGFDFFLSLTKPQEIVPSLSIGQYVSFAIKLLFAFGIVFEFPLVVLFLSRLGLVTPKWMVKNTKYAVILICIFSAILTPPDPFTMFLMAIPLVLLYILSILICFLTFNRKQAKLKKEGLL
jgi:sec-independent protein translocase protein TatC